MRNLDSTPTPTARRRKDVLTHAAKGVLAHGSRVRCPVCGWRFDTFKDDWNRPRALCWRCGAHERHRAQMLLLQHTRPDLLSGVYELLHFAPEWCMRKRLVKAVPRYAAADLFMDDVDLKLDLQKLDLPDDSYDAVICSHVLEHVEDDAAAMHELCRITRRWALIMVPLDINRSETFEDASIADPAERERHFWQYDHVRLYAPDIEDRLHDAGFTVETLKPREVFGARLVTLAGLAEADYIWLCRPR